MNLVKVRSVLAALLFRRRLEREMEQEWQFHLDARVDDLVSRGVSQPDAQTHARLEFGHPAQWKASSRDARGVQLVDEVRQDLTFAFRHLSRAPTFTVVAIMTLALGIGANTAIFSVVNAVLLRPLPYKESDRLVRFVENFPPVPGSISAPMRVPGIDLVELETLRSHSHTLSHVSVLAGATMILTTRDEAIRVEGSQISSAMFPMLGAQARLGRTFAAHDDTANADAVVVLSHRLWRQHFESDPAVLGRVITLDGKGRSVIGVMPEGFESPDARDAQTQLWVPFVLPALPPGAKMSRPAIGRVKEGVTLDAAATEVNALLPVSAGNRSASAPVDASRPPRFELVSVQDFLVSPVKSALLVLAAAVGVVLLIACVNVANLLLARMAAREREFAVRLALGAGRGRLVRQVLTESVLLALVGALAGVGLAFGGLRLLRTLATTLSRRDLGPNAALPRLDEIGIDTSALLFTVVAAVVTGVVFGLAPAVRHSAQRSLRALRDGSGPSRSGFGVFRLRLQSLLVISQIALAMVLFIGGGLLIHSFAKLSNVDPGYDVSDDVLTFQVSVPRGKYTPALFATMAEDIAARLGSAAGIRSAGYSMNLPMVVGRAGESLRTTREPLTQAPLFAHPSPERPLITRVSRDFLGSLGIRLIAGRGFVEADGPGRPPVMLISGTVARSGVLGENPIGKHVYALGAAPIEVVGVVEDIRMLGLDQEPVGQAFVDVRQFPPSAAVLALSPSPAMLYFALQSNADAGFAFSSIRAAVRQVEPRATVDNFATAQQLVSNSIARPRLYAVLLGIFAGVAVTLAAVGIYGVMAYTVTRRTREMGIRIALGAARADVMRLLLGQNLVLTAAGIALGLAGAAAVTQYLRGLLFGLTPLDPMTFVVVAVLFGVIATLAAFVPARRAMRADPVSALRCE
jgi:predicted permease